MGAHDLGWELDYTQTFQRGTYLFGDGAMNEILRQSRTATMGVAAENSSAKWGRQVCKTGGKVEADERDASLLALKRYTPAAFNHG